MTVSRRQARQDAMVVLYQHELTGSPPDLLFSSFADENGHEADQFTRDIVSSVLANADALDNIIDRCSRNWPAHRMAALERAILRVAVFEITELDEIPVAASIDEAVILAKRFCSREAAVLINGILGKLADEGSGAKYDE